MQLVTELTENAFAVQVQSLAWGFDIWEAQMSLQGYKKGDVYVAWMNGTKSEKAKLPPGSWSILGKANELTEEQWKQIVDKVDYDVPPSPGNDFQGDWRTAYRDYQSQEETGCSEYPYVLKATASGLSLLKSKGLNPETTLILQKI